MPAILAAFGWYAGWFEKEAAPLAYKDLIRVSDPKKEQTISSPLMIEGEARGTWYFEATFPVTLVDWDGRIIAEHYAEAQGGPDAEVGANWMTEDFVPFKATLEFESPYKPGDPDFMKRGAVILRKSNPSGLPEHDDALEFTVFFSSP